MVKALYKQKIKKNIEGEDEQGSFDDCQNISFQFEIHRGHTHVLNSPDFPPE